MQIVNGMISFAVLTFLFCAAFKILPDVRIGWRVVWFGGAVTALLFTIGKELIGMYLGQGSVASVYWRRWLHDRHPHVGLLSLPSSSSTAPR